ncbi:unnamed protein product, partial [Nesidiocoris tenuis]
MVLQEELLARMVQVPVLSSSARLFTLGLSSEGAASLRQAKAKLELPSGALSSLIRVGVLLRVGLIHEILSHFIQPNM